MGAVYISKDGQRLVVLTNAVECDGTLAVPLPENATMMIMNPKLWQEAAAARADDLTVVYTRAPRRLEKTLLKGARHFVALRKQTDELNQKLREAEANASDNQPDA